MSKMKIGLEITDLWNIGAYRDVIFAMQDRPEMLDKRLVAGDIELFVISTNDSSIYVWNVGAKIGLETDHIIVSPTEASKIASIETNKIDIFLDSYNPTVMTIDVESEYADGILVDSKQDYYRVNPKWYSELVDKINRLLDEL